MPNTSSKIAQQNHCALNKNKGLPLANAGVVSQSVTVLFLEHFVVTLRTKNGRGTFAIGHQQTLNT